MPGGRAALALGRRRARGWRPLPPAPPRLGCQSLPPLRSPEPLRTDCLARCWLRPCPGSQPLRNPRRSRGAFSRGRPPSRRRFRRRRRSWPSRRAARAPRTAPGAGRGRSPSPRSRACTRASAPPSSWSASGCSCPSGPAARARRRRARRGAGLPSAISWRSQACRCRRGTARTCA